jgi:hypothetical protein
VDPFQPPITQVPGLTRDTSAQDAEVLRRALNSAFNLLPPDTILGDQKRRGEFAEGTKHVVGITVIIAAVSEILPGAIGAFVASVLAGGEKDPGTGKFIPKIPMAGNFAPSPIGFQDPKSQGIKPNFYLPGGSSTFIPPILDRFGLGLPEQRAEDAVANTNRLDALARSQAATARAAVKDETEATLKQIIAGGAPLTRSSVVIATTPAPLPRLQAAAEEELLRRQSGPGAPLPAQLDAVTRALELSRAAGGAALTQTQQQIAALEGEQARIQRQLAQVGAIPDPLAGLLGGAIAAGSFKPEAIEPINDAARRNQAGATGIRKQLVSERADP